MRSAGVFGDAHPCRHAQCTNTSIAKGLGIGRASVIGVGSYRSLTESLDSGFGAFLVLLIAECSADANRSLKLA